MSKFKIKYIDYVDGKYVNDYPKSDKVSLFLALPKLKITSQEYKNVFLLDNKFLLAVFNVVHSGSEKNNRRRIQVDSNQYYKSEIIPMGIHISGDVISYIFFSSNDFLKNVSTITSIWISYEMIILNIQEKINLKYKTNNGDYIYITNNFDDFISNKDLFLEIEKDDEKIIRIKNELKGAGNIKKEEFQEQKKGKNETIFSKAVPKYKEINDGRKAEKIVYDKLSSDLAWCQKNFQIENIDHLEWLNIREEQFKPYDLVINKNIYIDVKGTWESEISFTITENENLFRKSIIEKGHKYFIVNVLEVDKESNHIIKVLNDDLIKGLSEKTETKYIYREDK